MLIFLKFNGFLAVDHGWEVCRLSTEYIMYIQNIFDLTLRTNMSFRPWKKIGSQEAQARDKQMNQSGNQSMNVSSVQWFDFILHPFWRISEPPTNNYCAVPECSDTCKYVYQWIDYSTGSSLDFLWRNKERAWVRKKETSPSLSAFLTKETQRLRQKVAERRHEWYNQMDIYILEFILTF